MPSRNRQPRIYVYGDEGNLRYVTLRTPDWQTVRDWLVTNDIPATWSPTFRGWHVRTDRIGDAVARAEIDGFRVIMKGSLALEGAR